MQTPNLFLIGAPKCGTTALHEYLAAHPKIYMSPVKEPHHYSQDLPGRNAYFPRDEYLSLFAPATAAHAWRGESSVYYLYSQVAVPRILAEHPQARFIAMVRNPLEMAPSLHAQLLNSLTEDEADFATAWRLQSARARGELIPASCTEPRYLQYRDISSLGAQLQRAMLHLMPWQLHAIVFDDFRDDPAKTYAQVLEFLQLPHDGRTEFPRVNPSTRIKHRWLRRLLDQQRIPTAWRKLGRHWRLDRVHQRAVRWNEAPQPRAALELELRRELVHAFSDDVKLLAELLHRDLNHWLAL
jgi:hypothetical protein